MNILLKMVVNHIKSVVIILEIVVNVVIELHVHVVFKVFIL